MSKNAETIARIQAKRVAAAEARAAGLQDLLDATCRRMETANAELEILRRLERAVFCGDALACSSKVPPILDELLAWSKEHRR